MKANVNWVVAMFQACTLNTFIQFLQQSYEARTIISIF